MVFLTGTGENGGLGSLVFSPQISLALFNLCLSSTQSPPAPSVTSQLLKMLFRVGQRGPGLT